MEVKVYPTGEVLDRAVGVLNEVLMSDIEAPLLFLTAGGSAMAMLTSIRPECLRPGVTIAMSDDRFSSHPAVNNFSQVLRMPFAGLANRKGAKFIDTFRHNDESMEEYGDRFDKALKDWRAANPNGRVVMTQGIGPDGHICGIMPFPEDASKFATLFEDANRWAVVYDASGKNEFPLRMSVTISFLRSQVDTSIVYAVGEQKKVTLQRLLEAKAQVNELPSLVLMYMRQAVLFTDQPI